MRRYLILSFSVLGGLLLGPSPGISQTKLEINTLIEGLSPAQKEQFDRLAEELRCPTCTGLSIHQSDAPFSLQIKKALITNVTAGKTDIAIMEFFRERFGLWILRSPPKEGFHIVADVWVRAKA